MNASRTEQNINEMFSILNRITTLAKDIGTFNDGIHVREQIQSNVQKLTTLSKSVRADIQILRQNDDPAVDSLQSKFESLSTQIKAELPSVIASLRSAAPSPNNNASSGMKFGQQMDQNNFISSEPLLNQDMLNSDSDQLNLMEHEVNSILSVMREIHQLFSQTMQEIQKQRHLVSSIDQVTTSAVEKMQSGNQQLDKATEHQSGSRRALCWIFIVIGIVVVGVVVFCVIYFTKKKKE